MTRRRSSIRRAARALGLVVAALLGVALVFPPLWAALVPAPSPPAPPMPAWPADAGGVAGDDTVYVVDWGYHTAIVIRQPAGWRMGPPGREGSPWLEYAWGDRGFYRDSDFRPHAVYATLVLPTPSVTYLAGRDAPPVRGPRHVWARTVDARTRQALLLELERSIRRDAAGRRVAPSGAVPGYAGRFYDANGRYLWANDCNRWTVERLATVGLADGGWRVVLSGQVGARLHGFAPVTPPRR
jgi:hypothetical protein